ncbi:MAG TPA: DASS family sodium-coupled anion symporter [Pirellulales bacterium]|jgi:sodium-dependent dicarboxylate transporter 2/3/5
MNEPQPRSWISNLGLLAGPAAALTLWLAWDAESGDGTRREMAGAAVWIIIWWLTEALPLAATALLPLVLFPALRILPASAVAANYGESQIFLFLGGFLIALAVERAGLHRRVALAVVAAIGDSPRRIVLGFVLATGLISMWMSNTATALLMMPMAASVLTRADEIGRDPRLIKRLAIALVLGVGYAASMGGIATLIGTPPNLAFRQLYMEHFPAGPDISFGGWMLLATPLSLALLFFCWFALVFILYRLPGGAFFGGRNAIADERRALGPMTSAERRVAAIFLATAAAWIFREPVSGWGWAPLLGLGRVPGVGVMVDDTTVAIAMALLCFVIPSKGWNGPPLLAWHDAHRVPWGILILFGGGLALADGLSAAGLDQLWGGWLGSWLTGQSQFVVVAATTVGLTGFTEVASNVSAVQITMPLLAESARQVPCDPRLLMVPATLAASCGFMLPVGTPVNAIAYGTGRVRMRDMVVAGVVMDVASIVLIVSFVLALGHLALGIEVTGLPSWAAEAR